ncbi:MAG: hypothetical protein LPK38_07890, partial [Actinomycetes bacterium]|nr:hypothetical protein [Actinomycetes bacterium]MDX5381194.1 hypothetical protein [Actinomycetes bacterium]MDX5400486.1 hypothetical protein [Actinomycetes bacterium]MDX5450961.1 hypothetical protein [Actinomycetes bacterium]
PEILVLDEPTSNLDPFSRRELAEILAGLDITVLMTTHDLPYALQLCERSVILSGGRVVADGPTAEVLADSETMAAHRLELPYGFDPSQHARTTSPGGLGAQQGEEAAADEVSILWRRTLCEGPGGGPPGGEECEFLAGG